MLEKGALSVAIKVPLVNEVVREKGSKIEKRFKVIVNTVAADKVCQISLRVDEINDFYAINICSNMKLYSLRNLILRNEWLYWSRHRNCYGNRRNIFRCTSAGNSRH